MTDKRDEDSAGKQGQSTSKPAEPNSGAGYGDHAGERQKGNDVEGGEEKSA